MNRKKELTKTNSNVFSILRYVGYSSVIIFFIVVYFINEHLNSINYKRSSGDYDYLLLGDSGYIIATLVISVVMLAVADWSIAKSRYRNSPSLIISGAAFYGVALMCLLDITIGSWGIPGRCGDGFTLGNCFLAEGLGELVYMGVIPGAFIIGTILFYINKRKADGTKKLSKTNSI